MECDEVTAQDRVDSLIFVVLNAFLVLVLVAALAVGARDVMAMSAKRGPDRGSNITAPQR